jgi:hypothetical protein
MTMNLGRRYEVTECHRISPGHCNASNLFLHLTAVRFRSDFHRGYRWYPLGILAVLVDCAHCHYLATFGG